MKKQNEELNDLNDLKDKENTNYKKYCRIAWEDFVYIKELKAEAVKWVKYIKKNGGKVTDENFMVKFFNLTEEDLK